MLSKTIKPVTFKHPTITNIIKPYVNFLMGCHAKLYLNVTKKKSHLHGCGSSMKKFA